MSSRPVVPKLVQAVTQTKPTIMSVT